MFTAATIWLARYRGWLVYPRSDRWSKKPVAQFGGVAILLSFLAGSFFCPLTRLGMCLCILTACMGAVGLWDDVRGLSPRLKLGAQAVLATLAISTGVIYPLTAHRWINVAFTMLFILGITNAFNLLDNMDGLAAGIGINIAVFMILLRGASMHSYLVIAMAGALVGYLFFNFHPAKIFMGDTGSLAIGFFLACAFIRTEQHVTTVVSLLFTPILVLFLPIFDTLLVSITRRLNGRAISSGAKDHSSHRLVMLGLSDRNAVLMLYAISALSGSVAFLWRRFWPELGPGALAIFLVAGNLFWLYLAQVQLPEEWLSRTNVVTIAIPEFLHSLATRGAAVLVDIVLVGASIYLATVLRFGSINSIVLPSFLLTLALAPAAKVPIMAIFSVYRRSWRAASFHELYPLFKSAVAGSAGLVVVLFCLQGLGSFSRAVIVIDFVLTFALCAAARSAHNLFSELLPRHPRRGCLLVGGSSARLFQQYLEWQGEPQDIVALAVPQGLALEPLRKIEASLPGTPVIKLTDLPALLTSSEITALYLLPECNDADVDFATFVAQSYAIPAHSFTPNVGAFIRPAPEFKKNGYSHHVGDMRPLGPTA
jgi:UDP-GlcNAc:undecaprenyl-phosphate GlcNAc-1-phosphate transferase